MFADPPLCPNRLEPPKKETGGQRRKRKHALPKVFLIMSQHKQIIGAFLITHLVRVGLQTNLVALVGGISLLSEPLILTASHVQSTNNVFSLKPDIEVAIRSSIAKNGVSLNANFMGFAQDAWRVWPVSDFLFHALCTERPPTHFESEDRHAIKSVSTFKALPRCTKYFQI